MRSLLRWLPLALSLLVHPATATDFETLYNAGVTARANGDHVDAADLFLRALTLSPGDPDALVQIGYTKLALNDAIGAAEAFGLALDQAPDYVDAQRGLARASLQSGDPERSIMIYRKRLESSREGADWLGLGDAYRAAGREVEAHAAYRISLADPAVASDARRRLEDPEFFRSRLDLSLSGSKLDPSGDEWRDVEVRFGTKASADTSVSVGAKLEHRYGLSDLYLDLQIDRQFSDLISGYVIFGGAGRGDFRPDAAVELGATATILGGPQKSASTNALFALRQDLYGDEAITTIKAGLYQAWANGRIQLTGRVIAVLSAPDETSKGWEVQGRATVLDGIDIFGGYSDVPETDGGQLRDLKTSFVGTSFNYGPASRVGIAYTVEDRSGGVKRETVSVSHSLLF